MRIGFVGVGVMGGGMARRALAQGHEVTVHDRSEEALARLRSAGAATATSAAHLARGSDFIVSSLPRAADVEAAFLGDEGICAGLRRDTVVIETSSSPPQNLQTVADAVLARGARLVDAPLCPSQNQELVHRPVPPEARELNAGARAAWAGNLCFFAGGSDGDVAAARPVLELLGLQTHHVGPLGAGKLVKLLHNTINLTALAAISETMVVAKRSGLDVRVIIDALATSLADSAMLRTQGQAFIGAGRFPKGLFPLAYSAKDLGYALECAKEVGVATDVMRASHGLFSRAAAGPYRDFYNPALFRFIDEEDGCAQRG